MTNVERYFIVYIDEMGNEVTTAKMCFPQTFIKENLSGRKITNIRVYKCNHKEDVTDMYVMDGDSGEAEI